MLGCEIVAMMQATDSRNRKHSRIYFRFLGGFPAGRSLLFEPEMRSVLVIVANVFRHEPFEMTLIDSNHMIKQIRRQLPTNRSAMPFCHGL